MGTAKPKAARPPAAALGWLRVCARPQNRGLALSALVLVVALGGLVPTWRRWGAPAMQSAEYVVTPDKIEITPPPTWVHSDVKQEVVRTAALTRLDLRDAKLVEQVASAFALHPWVRKVARVEKRYPARLRVELAYRRPVAVVEVTAGGQAGLLFIDEESVLLPSADFAPSQAKQYLRISASGETPAGAYGTAWGSQRIAGAARVAAAWGQRWQPLGLYRIAVVETAAGGLEYQLRTPRDNCIVWGAAPGSESAREPSPEQKVAALIQYVQDKGPLDREGAPALIDLRSLAVPAVRTANARQKPPR